MTRRLSERDRPRRALHSPRTRLDNIALVPASELHSYPQWRKCAQQLTEGCVLLVVPQNNRPIRAAGQRIASTLRREGKSAAVAIIRHPSAV